MLDKKYNARDGMTVFECERSFYDQSTFMLLYLRLHLIYCIKPVE